MPGGNMAFIPTPNTIRVSFQFTWESQIVEITIAVTKAAPWDVADITQTLGDLNDWMQGEILPTLSTHISLFNITGTSQESASAPVVELPVTPPVAGGLDNLTVCTPQGLTELSSLAARNSSQGS
jgi:hypothetical protein